MYNSILTIYEVYEVYKVYESSVNAAFQATTLYLSTVQVVGYTPP